MQVPVQITIRDIPSSSALENDIRKKAEKLERFNGRIISCKVVVEWSKKHMHHGKLYSVHIDTTVPGKEIVVTRKVNEDVYIAVRDAFNALTRRLEEHSHKRHGSVKKHEDLMHGHVARMIIAEGYGFIEGTDGNEYYFSVTNVTFPQFDQLVIGDAVQYTPILLSSGLQAQHITKERLINHTGG